MNNLEYMDYPRVLQSVMHVLSMVSTNSAFVAWQPQCRFTHCTADCDFAGTLVDAAVGLQR
jgi:hypothetical protein